MNHPNAIWTDQSGTSHLITELTDAHLINILKLLYDPNTVAKAREKFLARAKSEDIRSHIDAGSMFDDPAGLAASDHADDLRDNAASPDLDVLLARWPQLPYLEFELRRRGLSLT